MKIGTITAMLLLIAGAMLAVSSPAMELDYSTYLGGTEYDRAYAVAVGSDRSAYLAGETKSLDFPVVNAYQPAFSGQTAYTNVFVTRFQADGAGLVYSTYLGGSRNDGGQGLPDGKMGIAVDAAGAAYVTGYTTSVDFPTLNPFQAAKPGSLETAAAFVAMFDSAGGLAYSTFLGGSTYDYGAAIAVDGDGRVYVTGRTNSRDFPTLNAFQAAHGGGNNDVFVAKLSLSGSASLVYSTYLGGTGNDDRGYGIAVDTAGAAYVAGMTNSENFPTLNPYQGDSPGGYSDAFVTKFNPTGGLAYSTYLGGAAYDRAYAIAVDRELQACVTGDTTSNDYPLLFPIQDSHAGSRDAIVTKLTADGSGLVFSTYLGGGDFDHGRGIAIDSGGFVHVAGETRSNNFPLAYPYQDALSNPPNSDAFIAKFCGLSGFLVYSSYLGGQGDDAAYGIAVDDERDAYLAGGTTSDDFPIADPFQAARAGNEDAFLIKIGHTPRVPVIESGDYNGDGTADLAIFREASGLWAIRGLTRAYFGTSGDIPVSIDFTGNGTTNIALFRPSSGLWAIRDQTRIYFGRKGDIPVPGDYGGDGTPEAAVFRPSTGLWATRGGPRIYFGQENDVPVPGPYRGYQTEAAIYRGTTGLWAIREVSRVYFGTRNDYAVPGDYEGNGFWVPAVFRPATGLWAVRGAGRIYFGDCRFQPIPADYDGNGTDGVAVFRPAVGLWAVRGLTRAYYGRALDVPVTR